MAILVGVFCGAHLAVQWTLKKKPFERLILFSLLNIRHPKKFKPFSHWLSECRFSTSQVVPLEFICFNLFTLQRFVHILLGEVQKLDWDCPPAQDAIVTTRIILFLVRDPELNLHLPLLPGGGGTTQTITNLFAAPFIPVHVLLEKFFHMLGGPCSRGCQHTIQALRRRCNGHCAESCQFLLKSSNADSEI